MPVYYNEDEDNNRRRQNGNPNYGNNANFTDYRDPNRAPSDTDASSTGNHIGDLFRRHRMNQAEAQNDARQNWFQNARDRQTRDQGNNVFDRINRLNEHNPTQNRGDPQNQGQRGYEPQNNRNAPPQNLGASLHSLTEQMNNMHMDLAAHPIQPQRLSMLPQQQQQVKNLKDNLSVAHVDLEARKLHINLFEAINQKLNLGLDNDLERSKHIHLQQAMRLEEEKLRLQKADNLASKFTAALEMPKIVQPPFGFRRETNLLDKKNMVRMITPYDDTSLNSTRSFKLVWTEILNFGRGEYLNEDDYKTILSIILRGNIAKDFRIMDKEGKSLKDIVDELCVLYDRPHKLWTTSRKKWTTSSERRTRTSKSLWLVQTSSSDASNPSPPKRHGQKPTTTCERQSFAKLSRQPLALTSTWKNIVSSKPEQSTMSTHSSKWLTSTKATTAQFPLKISRRSTKWLRWLLGNHLWKSPGLRTSSITSSPKCRKTKDGKQN
jgi:hypothetical protein